MQAIKDQFSHCKNLFISYKIFVPILSALIVGAIVISLSFGEKIGSITNKVNTLETSQELLIDIKISLDSLVKK